MARENFNLALLTQLKQAKPTKTKSVNARQTARHAKKIIKNANKLKDQIAVIKIPSNIIDDTESFDHFADNISVLTDCGMKIIILHDFKEILDRKIEYFNLDNAIKGHNFGSTKSMQIYEMIISGHINKNITSKLSECGINCIGISCKDGGLVLSQKTRRLRDANIAKKDIVSEPIMVFPELLFEIEETMLIPIISPVSNSENGYTTVLEVYKTASMLAMAVGADYLIYMENNLNLDNGHIKISNHRELIEFIRARNLSENLAQSASYIIDNSPSTLQFVDANVADQLVQALVLS